MGTRWRCCRRCPVARLTLETPADVRLLDRGMSVGEALAAFNAAHPQAGGIATFLGKVRPDDDVRRADARRVDRDTCQNARMPESCQIRARFVLPECLNRASFVPASCQLPARFVPDTDQKDQRPAERGRPVKQKSSSRGLTNSRSCQARKLLHCKPISRWISRGLRLSGPRRPGLGAGGLSQLRVTCDLLKAQNLS